MSLPDLKPAPVTAPENQPAPPIKVELIQLPQRQTGNSFISVLSVLFLFCLLGIVAGFIYGSLADKVYESTATIMISVDESPILPSLEFERFRNANHPNLITEDNIVQDAVLQGSVASLRVFADLRNDEFGEEVDNVEFVQDSLEAVENPDDPDLVDIVFRCHVQSDAQTVLRHIVMAYEEALDQRTKLMIIERWNKLLQLRGVIENELEVAKNTKSNSPEYIQKIEQRLANVKGTLFDMKAAGFREPLLISPVKCVVLKGAGEGELIWPTPGTILKYGFFGGLVVGVIVCIFGAFLGGPESRHARIPQ